MEDTNQNISTEWPEIGRTFLGPQSTKMQVVDVWQEDDQVWVKYVNPSNKQDYSCLLEAFNSRYATKSPDPIPYNVGELAKEYARK